MNRILGLGIGLAMTASAAFAAEPPLTDIERTVIAHQCEDILVKYTLFNEVADFEGTMSLYSKDAVLIGAATGRRVEGHDNIRAYLNEHKPGVSEHGNAHKQVLSNVLIDVVDRDHAKGTSYMTVYFYPADHSKITELKPTSLIKMTSEFKRTPEGWRYSYRKLEEAKVVNAKK